MASLVGSASLIIGTKTAATRRPEKRARPVRKERCRNRRRAVPQRSLAAGAVRPARAIVSSVATFSATLVPHPRIEPGIGDIHRDVDSDDEQRHEQERALDHRII